MHTGEIYLSLWLAKGIFFKLYLRFHKIEQNGAHAIKTVLVASPVPNFRTFQYDLRRIEALHRDTVFLTYSSFYAESDSANNVYQSRSPFKSASVEMTDELASAWKVPEFRSRKYL